MNPIPIVYPVYEYADDGSIPIMYKDKLYTFTMAYEIIAKIPPPNPNFWKGTVLTKGQLFEKWNKFPPIAQGHIFEFLGNWAYDL